MIDVIKKVTLGGFPQKIHIKGNDEKNPVILFLHGGPGITNRAGVMQKHAGLRRDFTLVAWDQRGTCGSYKGVDVSTLTLDRLVEDAKELVEYLCKELKKEKIFIVGGSFGTELGTFLAYRYPEKIAAYLGFGQVVNGVKNEELSWNFTMEQAVKAGDEKSVEKLKECGPPVKGQYKGGFKGLMTQRKILQKYRGSSVKGGGFFKSAVLPRLDLREYTYGDIYGSLKGYKVVLSAMWESVTDYDFVSQCNKFSVPYYIFQGRHDMNTPSELIEEFYNAVDAPDKDLVWFENSAHGPFSEEADKFERLMTEKFLKIAKEEAEKEKVGS
ncbi:MAG: alpha/beta hydrolase [Clostridiales bacterium]|jgi:pimeloyl-ACP methyl ester carboxylesterase|nr:alpha/beta hydrolase [Clostridiales bacterium]